MTVETTQGTVTVTIDGFEIRVPKGTLVIRAAELLGMSYQRVAQIRPRPAAGRRQRRTSPQAQAS